MYLIKIGNTELPEKYCIPSTYKVSSGRKTLFSALDATGALHETVYIHARHSISFSSSLMTDTDISTITALLDANWIDAGARKIQVQYYDIQSGTYATGIFKLAEFKLSALVMSDDFKASKPLEFELMEY